MANIINQDDFSYETLSTLRFASKAKTIVTSPIATYVTEGSQDDLRDQVSILMQKLDKLKKANTALEESAKKQQEKLNVGELKSFLRSLPSVSIETAENIVKFLANKQLTLEGKPANSVIVDQANIERITENVLKLEKLRAKDQDIIDIQQHCLHNLQCQVNDLIALNTQLSIQEKPVRSQNDLNDPKTGIAAMMATKLADLRQTLDMNIVDIDLQDSIDIDNIDNKTRLNQTVDHKKDYLHFQDCSLPKTHRSPVRDKKKPDKSLAALDKVLGPLAGSSGKYSGRRAPGSTDLSWKKQQYYVQPKVVSPMRAALPRTTSGCFKSKTPTSAKFIGGSPAAHSKSPLLQTSVVEVQPRDPSTRVSNTKDLEIIGWLREVDKLQRENEDLRQSARQDGKFEVYRLRAENAKLKEALSKIAGFDISQIAPKDKRSKSGMIDSSLNSANFSKMV